VRDSEFPPSDPQEAAEGARAGTESRRRAPGRSMGGHSTGAAAIQRSRRLRVASSFSDGQVLARSQQPTEPNSRGMD
jgi:hypothetical protein